MIDHIADILYEKFNTDIVGCDIFNEENMTEEQLDAMCVVCDKWKSVSEYDHYFCEEVAQEIVSLMEDYNETLHDGNSGQV